MDNIKFRAWDGTRYRDEDDFYVRRGTVYKITEFDGLRMIDWVLEQSTGMMDLTGFEIYEGDIVKLRSGRVGPVIYSERGTKFSVRIYRDGYWKNEPHLMSLIGCKIIGNIHKTSVCNENKK